MLSLAKGIKFTTNRRLSSHLHKESGEFVINMINMFFVKIMASVAKGLFMLFSMFELFCVPTNISTSPTTNLLSP
jgi:hypothetical protein